METIFDTQLEDIDVVDALREAGVEAPEAVYGACRKRAEEETCSSSSSSTEGCLSTGDAAALLLFTFSHGVLPAEHEEVRGLTPLDALNVGLAGGEYAKVRRLLWVMWRALRKLPHEYFSSLFVRIPVKVLSASDDEERAVKSAFLMTSPDAVSAAAAASATSATSPAQTPVSTTPNPSLLTLKESSSSGSVCSNTTATASRFLVKLTGFVSVYNLGKYSFFPDRQNFIVEPIRNYEKGHYVVNTIEPYYSTLIPFSYVPINPYKLGFNLKMKATEVAEHTAKNCESLDHCIAGFGLLSLYSSLGLWDAIPSKTLASTLLSALGKHTEDLSLCRSGCAVVRHLAERPEALALVATPEAVRVLSALLGAHFQHEDAAAALCLALYELVSAVEALQGVLLSCGGVGALLRALAAHPGNDGICKAACDVLVYLSTAPGVAGALAACVPGVAEALRALAGDAATCGCLCELLCHVTEGLYEKIPGEKELVNALLGVVRTHEADPVVTGLACQVLGHVVELSEDGRQLVWGLVENDPLLSKFIGSIF